ncbi:hypothetical protein JNW90_01105 [Micromonospora sp. STR1s_5]|nr:hypothetical protein [Micromonospora sp. STR1s_5]
MSKKTKRPARPDKSRIAAQRRAERSLYPPDFRMSLPTAPVDVLEEITPWPPKWTLQQGSLALSPAQTWMVLQAEQPGDAGEMIARWPFRIANIGKAAGGWVCLASLAYEQKIDVTDFARHQCELEDNGLLVWSSEYNVYVLAHDLSGTREEKLEKIDRLWKEMASESPAERAQRRWARPQVIPRTPDE